MPGSENGSLAYLQAEQVRAVLARAAELDASELTGLTLPDVRRIAEEAGISPRAIDQALTELSRQDALVPEPPPPPRRRSLASRFATALKLGGIALFLGIGGSIGMPADSMLFVLAVLGAVALYRALANRRSGSTSDFQTEISAMTVGLITGHALAAPWFIADEGIFAIGILGVLAGLAGSVIVSFGRPDESAPADAGARTLAGAPHPAPHPGADTW
ncbi:MAG TPA: hypothetical protein VHG09_09105 [Longimicrobiales bacterium]|nr:hypothetical protein [Longimicrobiales bacterium]